MVQEEFIKIGSKYLETSKLRASNGGEALVLLHEGLGCVKLWGKFPTKLKEKFGLSVFSYSRFGYGRSSGIALPRSLDYLREEALEVLPSILSIFELDSYTLVGHSDGASIALNYAALVSDPKLKSLILLAPHVKVEKKTVDEIRQVSDSYESSGLREKLRRYHEENVDCAFYGWSQSWLNPDFARWSVEHVLPKIKIPVLAIRGTDDPYNTTSHLESIRENVSGLTWVTSIPECGHSPHRDSPDSTLKGIESFRTAAKL
tara:strand:- start:175 stop:954 length:780 start_codon:yes stop_codon:yes gene_type:complete